jgi:hypothetical protein
VRVGKQLEFSLGGELRTTLGRYIPSSPDDEYATSVPRSSSKPVALMFNASFLSGKHLSHLSDVCMAIQHYQFGFELDLGMALWNHQPGFDFHLGMENHRPAFAAHALP